MKMPVNRMLRMKNEERQVLGPLSLSASTVLEASAENTVVGTVLGLTAGSTPSMTDTAGGRFKLVLVGSDWIVKTGATPTDFETTTSHNVTLRELLGTATNSPRDTVLAISVTNVQETYRYWAVFSDGGSSHASQTGLSALGFAETIGGSLNVTGTPISGGGGADQVSHGPDQLFDGNAGTYWRRTSNAAGVYAGLDLGSNPVNWKYFVQARATVDANDNTLGPKGLILKRSDDGVTWTTVDTSDQWGDTWLLGVEKVTNYRTPVTGSHLGWGLFVLDNNGGIAIQIEEIEFIIGGVDGLPAGHANDSLIRQVATADNSGTHPVSDAWNDNIFSTPWTTGVGLTTNHRGGAIFPAPVTVTKIRGYSNGISAFPKNVKVQYTDDNITWHDIGAGATWSDYGVVGWKEVLAA